VGFEVDDLDGCVAMLKKKAVPIVLDVFETPVCRLAVIADPDGNHLTMHRRKPWRPARDAVRGGRAAPL